MGRRLQTGRGSLEDGDVYVLEQRQSTASSVSSDSNSSLKYCTKLLAQWSKI